MSRLSSFATSTSSHRRLIHFRRIARLVGSLLLIEAVFMAIPLIVALANGDDSVVGLAVAEGLTVTVGLASYFLIKPEKGEFNKRDSVLLTSMVWIMFSLFGMIPFMFAPMQLGFCDAFFEAMSGFTTTGVSVFVDVETLPPGIHLWRCMMQWIGGIGIVIFTIALLPALNSSGGMLMFNAELSGVTHDKVLPRISQTAKRLWGIYLMLTLVCTMLLWLGPMSLFDSICHALSTVSTGGFSTNSLSIRGWDSTYVLLVLLVFMFIGGVNFMLIYRATIGQFKRVWRDDNFRTYVIIIIAATLFVTCALLLTGHQGVRHLLVDPAFQVVSALSSTGYTVSDIDSWGTVVLPVLLLLLFTGACAGSTSGGIKIDRLVYLAKNAINEVRKSLHPNRIYPITINSVVKPPEIITKVGAFMTLYFVLLVAGGVVLSLTGLTVTESFFACFACIGNTGLGIGALASSYAGVTAFGKLVLALLMMIGRLEIFTILVLFLPGFWRR